MERKRDTIVLYPSPGMGHLISMVELGKRILSIAKSPTFSTISILVPEAPFNTGSTAPYIRRVSSSIHPSPSTTSLPPSLSLPSPPLLPTPKPSYSASSNSTTPTSFKPSNPSPSLFQSAPLSSTYSVLLFSTSLPNSTSLPTASSGAAVLAVFLHIPILHCLHSTNYEDMHIPLHVPGVPPFPASSMPLPMLDRNDEAYHFLLYVASQLTKSSRVIVNSFDALEPRAMKAILDGSCVLDSPTPPVSCIGPLIAPGDSPDKSDCLAWLVSQPRRSAAQLKEIAMGLEKRKQRFLWVVRSPPTESKSQRFLAPPEPDLDALITAGRLHGADQGYANGGKIVGPTGGRVETGIGGWVLLEDQTKTMRPLDSPSAERRFQQLAFSSIQLFSSEASYLIFYFVFCYYNKYFTLILNRHLCLFTLLRKVYDRVLVVRELVSYRKIEKLLLLSRVQQISFSGFANQVVFWPVQPSNLYQSARFFSYRKFSGSYSS